MLTNRGYFFRKLASDFIEDHDLNLVQIAARKAVPFWAYHRLMIDHGREIAIGVRRAIVAEARRQNALSVLRLPFES
jgi:hypothetical protein